jgi:hypothetical protein
MNKIGVFLSFAFLILFLSTGAEGETFASVPMYISGEPEGILSIESPSGSNVDSVVIASNEQDQQGVFKEIGRWSTGSLDVSSNISGDWSGNAWVSSNRDATINIRYTIIQDENNLDSFEFSGEVAAGDTIELTGSSDFELTNIDKSPLTLLVEASWTAQAGTPPPTPPANTTILMEYGSSSRNTGVVLSISHVQIQKGGEPFVNEGQSEITIYIKVYSAFGVDDILSSSKDRYGLSMGPRDESLWDSSVDSVSEKSNYMEVQFLWSFEGKSLPSGDNDYDVNVRVTDSLSSEDWVENLIFNIYITPKPDVEMDSVSSTSKKVVMGNSAIYTLSVRNTGSGEDEFIVTTEYDNNWDISIDFTDFNLDAGESKTIKVTISPQSSVSDGEKLLTTVTVTAASDSSIKDSTVLTTTAEEAEPDWDFSVEVVETDNDNFDGSSFVIKDRMPLEIEVLITNRGNTENNFNIAAQSQGDAFVYSFTPSFISSLEPDQEAIITVKLTPREDYFGTSTLVEMEGTSAGNGNKETATLSVEFSQSGLINLRDSNLQLASAIGSSSSHTFDISNLDIDEAKRIYFAVSGVSVNDQLAKDWVAFFDKDGKQISYGSFLTLLPSQQSVEITMRTSIPSNSDIESYDLQVWMMNENSLRISESNSFKVKVLEATEEESSNTIMFGGVFVFGILVAAYIYRNFSQLDDDYDDYEEDHEDDREYQDIADFDNTAQPTEIEPEPSPLPQEAEPIASINTANTLQAVEPSVAALPIMETPEVKMRRKWFGLFGPKIPVDSVVTSEPAIAEPVVAQPEPVVAQPVVAEPVVAQPVVAEPVVAQPVVAELVVAQPVVAEPVVAQPVVAQPVVAEPIVAEAVIITDPEEQS